MFEGGQRVALWKSVKWTYYREFFIINTLAAQIPDQGIDKCDVKIK